jgi:ArsR family metal-binding transcriptional regulator
MLLGKGELMSTIHVNGNKVTTSNVDEAKSILNNLFPTQVAFIEDDGKVCYSQNMSVQEAKHILNPKKSVKPAAAKPSNKVAVTKPKKKVAKKVKVEKPKKKSKVTAKKKDKPKKKGKK